MSHGIDEFIKYRSNLVILDDMPKSRRIIRRWWWWEEKRQLIHSHGKRCFLAKTYDYKFTRQIFVSLNNKLIQHFSIILWLHRNLSINQVAVLWFRRFCFTTFHFFVVFQFLFWMILWQFHFFLFFVFSSVELINKINWQALFTNNDFLFNRTLSEKKIHLSLLEIYQNT